MNIIIFVAKVKRKNNEAISLWSTLLALFSWVSLLIYYMVDYDMLIIIFSAN